MDSKYKNTHFCCTSMNLKKFLLDNNATYIDWGYKKDVDGNIITFYLFYKPDIEDLLKEWKFRKDINFKYI